MKLVNEWVPWIACLNNWAILNQTTLGNGGGPAISNNYHPTTDYTWVLPPQGFHNWNQQIRTTPPPTHISHAFMNTTYRNLQRPLGEDRKQGGVLGVRDSCHCGGVMHPVGTELITSREPTVLMFWKTPPPCSFKFAVGYYQEIV